MISSPNPLFVRKIVPNVCGKRGRLTTVPQHSTGMRMLGGLGKMVAAAGGFPPFAAWPPGKFRFKNLVFFSFLTALNLQLRSMLITIRFSSS